MGLEQYENEEEETPVSEEAKARARKIFERANKEFREREAKGERVAILNAWLAFEKTHGGAEDIEAVEKQMPRKVKKRRQRRQHPLTRTQQRRNQPKKAQYGVTGQRTTLWTVSSL